MPNHTIGTSSWRVGGSGGGGGAGGGGEDNGGGVVEVFGVDHADLPAGHFAGVVAAFASTAPVAVAGGSAVGMAGDVIEVADRRPAERIPACFLIAEPDQAGQPAVEAALVRIPTHN